MMHEAEKRCREIDVWMHDTRFVDRVAEIIALAMERTPDDISGISSALVVTANVMAGHMDEADRVALARLMLKSAKRLDGDVTGATTQ